MGEKDKDPIIALPAFVLGAAKSAAALAGAAAAMELVKGPISNALQGVFPHEQVPVRMAAAMCIAGALTPEEFSRLSAIAALTPEDRRMTIRYVTWLRQKRIDADKIAQFEKLSKEAEKVAKEIDKTYIDEYEVYARSTERDLEKFENLYWDIEEDDINEETRMEIDEIEDEIRAQEKKIAPARPITRPKAAPMAKISIKDLEKILSREFLVVVGEAIEKKEVLDFKRLEDRVWRSALGKDLITKEQFDYAIAQNYALKVRGKLSGMFVEIVGD